MMTIDDLKPQHQMTKEDLVTENIELRKYIDKLEAKLDRKSDVFQTGSLTEIIEACTQAVEAEKKEKVKSKKPETKQALVDMKNLYGNYRKRFGEKPVSREVALNMKMILNQSS